MARGKSDAPTKLILSDSDGVIVDSFALLYRNMSKLCQEKAGKVLSDKQYRDFFKGNALANVMAFIGSTSTTGFSSAEKAVVFEGYTELQPFVGIVDAYQTLAKHHTLAIITSTSIEYAAPLMDRIGLSDSIAAFIGPEVAVAKDARIRIAMEQFGGTPEQTWYITDTVGDIAEAKLAGVKTLAITWGFHDKADLLAAMPDAVAHNIEELQNILA